VLGVLCCRGDAALREALQVGGKRDWLELQVDDPPTSTQPSFIVACQACGSPALFTLQTRRWGISCIYVDGSGNYIRWMAWVQTLPQPAAVQAVAILPSALSTAPYASPHAGHARPACYISCPSISLRPSIHPQSFSGLILIPSKLPRNGQTSFLCCRAGSSSIPRSM
jgi:hypothetical protein